MEFTTSNYKKVAWWAKKLTSFESAGLHTSCEKGRIMGALQSHL